MKQRLTAGVALGIAGVLFASASLQAGAPKGKFNKMLAIGDPAPDFKSLPGTDDKQHSLSDYKDAKLVVVTFTCNKCPVAVAYEDRLIEFTKKYSDKGVAHVAINVNDVEADRLDKMKERAEKKGFNFDYLFDESQESARAYGATVTPHLFVLDQKRQIAYMGAFDDNNDPSKVKENYLIDAVEALLAGKKPEVAESQQRGCGINYKK